MYLAEIVSTQKVRADDTHQRFRSAGKSLKNNSEERDGYLINAYKQILIIKTRGSWEKSKQDPWVEKNLRLNEGLKIRAPKEVSERRILT